MDGLQALVWCLNNRGIPPKVKDGLKDIYNVIEAMAEIAKNLEKK